MIKNKELELYFHIPFCVKKCNYCDFLSAPATTVQMELYMEALFAELEGRAEECQNYHVISIFIGGGTPSLLEGKWIVQLLDKVRTYYTLDDTAEITIEVNPGTVDADKLQQYKQAGINRLSIGLQSLQDKELQELGRIHNKADFMEVYQLVRKSGFTNVNVDVMSALPGQSLAAYCETLQQLLQLEPMPEHISAYSLIVEEGTPFYDWAEAGRLALPDEDAERKMYEVTKSILEEAGFHRYEISNYARPGYECRHNCGYWKRTDYLGFGIGAASLMDGRRFCNDSDRKEYMLHPLACRQQEQILSREEQMEETLFLGLRMMQGVGCEEFAQSFGVTLQQVYGEVIEKNIRDGLLLYQEDAEGKQRLVFTEKGIDVSNYCLAQFLFDDD